MSYILTPGGLHLTLNGRMFTLAKSDKAFNQVVTALNEGVSHDRIIDIIEAEKRRMEEAVSVAPGLEVRGGQIYYNSEVVHGTLGYRMLEMLKEGFDLRPMAAFLANLTQNPSNSVLLRLYDFIEYGKIPITPDGYILTFKAVRPDFKDIHSGTFDNSVGQVLSMPRNKVDDRDEVTCSHGFHVCSFDYLPHFSHANGHVVICKVNPADVVSIPTDYNNTKMRVCRYEVIDEYHGYYQNQGNVLANTTVAVDNDNPFTVQCQYREDGEWESISHHDRLRDAAEKSEAQLEDTGVFAVRVMNNETGVEVYCQTNPGFVEDNDDDDDILVNDGFTLRGYDLDDDEVHIRMGSYDTMADALTAAWGNLAEGLAVRIEVVNPNGEVEATVDKN